MNKEMKISIMLNPVSDHPDEIEDLVIGIMEAATDRVFAIQQVTIDDKMYFDEKRGFCYPDGWEWEEML